VASLQLGAGVLATKGPRQQGAKGAEALCRILVQQVHVLREPAAIEVGPAQRRPPVEVHREGCGGKGEDAGDQVVAGDLVLGHAEAGGRGGEFGDATTRHRRLLPHEPSPPPAAGAAGRRDRRRA